MLVAPGSTSVSVDVFFADDAGFAVTGMVAADFPACKWSGGANAASTTITLSDLAAITTAHPNDNTAGGIAEREGGWYRLDLPNNMFTSAGRKTLTFAETTDKRIIAPTIDCQYAQVDVEQAGGTAWGSGAITAASIASDAITAVKIADGAIDTATFAAGTTIPRCTLTDTATTLTNAPSDSSGVTTLLSRIPSGIFTGITSLAEWLGLIAGKQTGNSTARTEIRATGGGSGTFDETTDSIEAIRDRGDAAWITATGFSTLDAAGVRTAVGLASANLDTQLAAIQADSPNTPTKNVAFSNFMFMMVDDTDLNTPETGITVTATISKDGGSFASCANSVTEVSGGWYKINFSQAEMNADAIAFKATGTGCAQRNIAFRTQPT